MRRTEELRMVGGSTANKTNQEQGYEHIYNKRDTLVAELKSALSQKIVLFLGAGVSMKYGIPKWDTLLEKLYRKQFDIPDGFGDAHWADIKNNFLKGKIGDVLQQCRMIENEIAKKGLSFEEQVRATIYDKDNGFNLTPANEANTTLSLLLSHFFPKSKSNFVDSIVTFNFDDILEHKLPNDYNQLASPISKVEDIQSLTSDKLPIYHVHGYLPQTGDCSPIIFSETAYHTTYSEPYSWNNLVQISKLTNYTCLFVGISLNDPNMRRLIDSCQKVGLHQHFLITQKANRFDDYGKELFDEDTQKTIDGSFAQYAKSLGVNIIFVNNYEDDLKDVLAKITT